MGVPGLWDVLRPTGEVRSLTHLAVESGFVVNNHGQRAYRIGIDASIWFFHAQGGREGENPELRTLFFRCSRLLAMPFLPIFVFDGPKRPKIKRGKAVGGKEHWMVASLRIILDAFGFECRTAPGEAEAELAYLNRIGVIDAVLSDDVDCFLFGARTVIRNSSATLSGNRSHGARNADGKEDGQHVNIYRADDLVSNSSVSLSQGGLILIALLRGGDYDQHGIDGCGVSTAHALARAGFGDSLLEAARSTNHEKLATFLPTWRTAVRHELRTNASGFAPRKSPTLAKRITEDFPPLDVLRCYTHPITSGSDDTGTRGLDTLWRMRADIGKIAHACELFFEWGVEKTIVKRFRSFLWPGAVLRTLLQAALDKDQRSLALGTPSKHDRQRVETPSKALARTLSGMGLDSDDERYDHDDDDCELVTAIHGERRHASTDNVLEYRLEINPRRLVSQAKAGVTGHRAELADSAAAGALGSDEDDDEDDDGRKRGPKTPPPDPYSKLRIWMPAVMVQYAYPGLVEDFEARKAAKEAKKAKRGAGKRGKEVSREDGEEEAENTPAPKPKTGKHKIKATKAKPSKTLLVETDNDSGNDSPSPKSRMKTKPAGKPRTAQAKGAASTSSSRNPKSTTQLLVDDLFLVSSTTAQRKSKQQTSGKSRQEAGQPPPGKPPLVPRPFPMAPGLFTEPNRRTSPTPTHMRKHSSSSAASSSGRVSALKKSPRKSVEHTSPRKNARTPSPSPIRPLLAPKIKPLRMLMARPRAAKVDEDVIVISSDSDDPLPLIAPSAKPRAMVKKALTLNNPNLDSDLTEFLQNI